MLLQERTCSMLLAAPSIFSLDYVAFALLLQAGGLARYCGDGGEVGIEDSRTCPVCFQVFATSLIRRRHMQTHTGEQPFKCSMCEFRCARRDSLKRHAIKLHMMSPEEFELSYGAR